ncbi:MAG: hypothetical protein HYR76_08185 [Ignavibacteria bacterium]|nr:hypothetical protein [Ignavibacteria bacterium]
MTNTKGRPVLTWGVQEKDGHKPLMTLSYNLWMTPEEAIEGYCKLTGKSWDQLTKEGVQLVQNTVVVYDGTDQQNSKSSGAA